MVSGPLIRHNAQGRDFSAGMQPNQTDAGMPNESLLFQSLRPYLENTNRQQPIIGLDSITECVKVGSCNQEPLYVCEVCKNRMKRTDVRNHIMGTLHRYRYIKAQHPDLTMGWGHTVDVPKLAWPLMEMATVLEKREGPGTVKVLHLSAKAFKEMGERSAAIAVTQLTAVRGRQMQKSTPPPSELTQTGAVKSQRVQLSQKKKDSPAKVGKAAAKRQKSNVRLQHFGVETGPALPEADAAPFERPIAKSAEPRVPSEGRVNILDGHTVLGLDHVVECRGKDAGRSSCFLCHCCRVKLDPDNVIDHLTCPSHISNYLMEVYPECVDAMMGGLNDEKELLQSVALRVAHIEGRAEHKVLELPEHLCDQLSDKTYNWCVKFISDKTGAGRQKNTVSLKVAEAFARLTSAGKEGGEAGPAQAAKKRRTGSETNPVFKVSMPMSKGACVLERGSFSLPNTTAVDAPPRPPPSLAPETPSTDALDLDSDVDFGPLTVTLFETPRSPLEDSLPRHIDVQREDTEENIPVVIGHRKAEYGLPHVAGYTPHPEEKVQYNSNAAGARWIQHEPTQASDAGQPADCTWWPGSSTMEAGGPTSDTLPSCDAPICHDLYAEKSNVSQKPAVAFYYCTPRGQRRP